MALPPSPACSDPLPELTASPDQPWTCHTCFWLFTWSLAGTEPCLYPPVLRTGQGSQGSSGTAHRSAPAAAVRHTGLFVSTQSLVVLPCETFVNGGSLEGSFLTNSKRRNRYSPFSAPRVNCVLIREWAEEHFGDQLKTGLGVEEEGPAAPSGSHVLVQSYCCSSRPQTTYVAYTPQTFIPHSSGTWNSSI